MSFIAGHGILSLHHPLKSCINERHTVQSTLPQFSICFKTAIAIFSLTSHRLDQTKLGGHNWADSKWPVSDRPLSFHWTLDHSLRLRPVHHGREIHDGRQDCVKTRIAMDLYNTDTNQKRCGKCVWNTIVDPNKIGYGPWTST